MSQGGSGGLGEATGSSPLPSSEALTGASGPRPHERCPHCGASAVIEPSTALRFRCGVCGKARVPIDDASVVRSNEERGALANASRARSAAVAWKVGSVALTGMALVSMLVLALVLAATSPPPIATLAGAIAALVPLAVALLANYRAKQRSREIGPALDSAWQAATLDVLRSKPSLTADELAMLTRSTSAEAEQILITLSTDDLASSQVTEDGTLTFSASERLPSLLAASGASMRKRVAPASAPVHVRERAPIQEQPASTRLEALADEEAAALEQIAHESEIKR